MLTVKMVDGTMYVFEKYTEYAITNEFVVVKKDEQWIGVFNKNEFLCLYVSEV